MTGLFTGSSFLYFPSLNKITVPDVYQYNKAVLNTSQCSVSIMLKMIFFDKAGI
jgi:hypothetical protein